MTTFLTRNSSHPHLSPAHSLTHSLSYSLDPFSINSFERERNSKIGGENRILKFDFDPPFRGMNQPTRFLLSVLFFLSFPLFLSVSLHSRLFSKSKRKRKREREKKTQRCDLWKKILPPSTWMDTQKIRSFSSLSFSMFLSCFFRTFRFRSFPFLGEENQIYLPSETFFLLFLSSFPFFLFSLSFPSFLEKNKLEASTELFLLVKNGRVPLPLSLSLSLSYSSLSLSYSSSSFSSSLEFCKYIIPI